MPRVAAEWPAESPWTVCRKQNSSTTPPTCSNSSLTILPHSPRGRNLYGEASTLRLPTCLVVVLLELRLVVERVEVREPARHEEDDQVLGLRREVARPGRERVARVRRGGDRELAIEPQAAGRGEGRGAAEQGPAVRAVRRPWRATSVGRPSIHVEELVRGEQRPGQAGPGLARRGGRRARPRRRGSARTARGTRPPAPARRPSAPGRTPGGRPGAAGPTGRARPRPGGPRTAATGRGRTGCSAGRGPGARRWSCRAVAVVTLVSGPLKRDRYGCGWSRCTIR